MKSQNPSVFYIRGVVLFIFVFLVVSPSWAEIYKWRDAGGKVHFTDNLMEIPKEFRTEKHLEELRVKGLIDPEEEARKKQLKADQERKKLEKKMLAKSQAKKKKETITAEEKKVLSNVSFFLKNDQIAFDRQLSKPFGEELFKDVKSITQISINPKKKLIDQLSAFESPVSKQTLKFLKSSLATDMEVDSTKVYIMPNAEILISRLKNDNVGKGKIIRIIDQALASAPS